MITFDFKKWKSVKSSHRRTISVILFWLRCTVGEKWEKGKNKNPRKMLSPPCVWPCWGGCIEWSWEGEEKRMSSPVKDRNGSEI